MHVDQKSISIFWSIVKLHLQITKKSFTYSWPKALLTKSSQHLMHLFIHKNVHFLLLWDIFVRNLQEKVPHHVRGSKISDHQGSQCVTRSCLKVYFHLVNVNVCSLDLPNFHTYLTIQNVLLLHTFLDLQNVQWIIVHKT